jgi:hypothetical protein
MRLVPLGAAVLSWRRFSARRPRTNMANPTTQIDSGPNSAGRIHRILVGTGAGRRRDHDGQANAGHLSRRRLRDGSTGASGQENCPGAVREGCVKRKVAVIVQCDAPK